MIRIFLLSKSGTNWEAKPLGKLNIAKSEHSAILSGSIDSIFGLFANWRNVLDVSGTFIGLKAYADRDDSELDAEDRELLKTIKPAIENFEEAVDHLYNLTLENFDEEIQVFRASARLMEKISNILFRD